MKIKKIRNDEGTYNILLIQENSTLTILQQGMDYTLECKCNTYKMISKIDFEINKDMEEIYEIFNNLYETIINCNIPTETPNMPLYKEIVQNGVITVKCDAHSINTPNILRISKREDETINLNFEKIPSLEFKIPDRVSVHIRQSGSRIYGFACPFKTLFLELQNVREINEDKKLTLDK